MKEIETENVKSYHLGNLLIVAVDGILAGVGHPTSKDKGNRALFGLLGSGYFEYTPGPDMKLKIVDEKMSKYLHSNINYPKENPQQELFK